MNGLTVIFVSAVFAETAVRLWLAHRQIRTVAAHRDEVPAEFAGQIALADQRRAADYSVARVRIGRWDTLLDALIKLGFTVGGGLAFTQSLVDRLEWREPWAGAAVIAAIFLLLQIASLPLTVWRTFRVEARFGFNNMSPGLFALDTVKQLLLGFALAMPLAVATLALMQRAGQAWWAWAFALWVVATLLLTWAAPRFIAPLFNRFTALNDGALRERVEDLLRRCGFTAAGGVFVMDGSRRSAHGNAYFTGIGRNKRIVFFDTLLARIDVHEIEAVLAHELGHFRLNHVRQRLLLSLVGVFVGFALLGFLARLPEFYGAFGVPQSAEMALLLFLFVVPTFTFFASPLGAWWSRRHEREADDFAVRYCSAESLITALKKLYRDNATTLNSDPLHSAFYDSHPGALERIGRLRRALETVHAQLGV